MPDLRRLIRLSIAVALIIGVIIAIASADPIARWPGWNAVSALSALLAGIGLVFVALDLYLAQRGHSLEQTSFLMGLSERFLEARRQFAQAGAVLNAYEEVPGTMHDSEFHDAVEALRQCHESTLFLYQIAQLHRKGLVEADVLYLFYYSFLTEHPDWRLSLLADWCGTGLDLAANYNAREVARMITPIKELLISMGKIHRAHGGEPFDYQIREMERLEKVFVQDIASYDMSSPTYRGNFVHLLDEPKPAAAAQDRL